MRLALDRTARQLGQMPSGAVLIGDTPSDVQAGHALRARVIAVASGRSSREVLRAAGAEHVLTDLADTDLLQKLITEP